MTTQILAIALQGIPPQSPRAGTGALPLTSSGRGASPPLDPLQGIPRKHPAPKPAPQESAHADPRPGGTRSPLATPRARGRAAEWPSGTSACGCRPAPRGTAPPQGWPTATRCAWSTAVPESCTTTATAAEPASRQRTAHRSGRNRREEVLADGMVGVPAWGLPGGMADTLQALSDRIETTEKHPRARVMRDVQVALPCELTEPQMEGLAADFAGRLAARYRTGCPWAIHRPSPDQDDRNYHVHVSLPTRAANADGSFGKKLRALDSLVTGPMEIVQIRALWETTANAHLEAAGENARVHCGRRIDSDPEPTAPRGAPADVRAVYKRAIAAHREDQAGVTRVYAPVTDALALLGARTWDALEALEAQVRARIADTKRALARVRAALKRAREAAREAEPARPAPQPVLVVGDVGLPLGPAPPADNAPTTREPEAGAPDPEPAPTPEPTP